MAVVKDKSEQDYYYSPRVLLDPLEIYKERAKRNAAEAAGVERFVYKLFGSELIGSIAFAIDPFAKFRATEYANDEVYKRLKTPVRLRTRTRSRPTRYNVWRRHKRNKTSANYKLAGPNTDYGPMIGFWVDVTNSTGNYSPCDQHYLPEYSIDTVSSRRPKGIKGGIFEKYEYDFNCPGLAVNKRTYSTNSFPPMFGGFGQRASSLTIDEFTETSCAAMTLADQTVFLNDLRAQADHQMEKNAFRLLSKCIPTAPRFDLNRSIAELKDFKGVAKSLAGVRSTADIVKRLSEMKEFFYKLQKQPDLILSLNFAVVPVLSDIQAILDLPARVAKRVNFLIARNGKPTMYRTKSPCEPWSYSPPGFTFDYSGLYDSYSVSSSFRHEAELRMAVEAIFEFPPVDLPEVRDDLVQHLYSTDPSFTGFYNLIPWTWLVDWFTGFGNYISIIEKINNDRSLINDGYLTYACKGSISNQQTIKLHDQRDIWERPSANVSITTKHSKLNTVSLDYSFQKRVKLSSLGVNSTVVPDSMSPFQQLIIGALVGQRLFK